MAWHRCKRPLLSLLLLATTALIAAGAGAHESPRWRQKVDRWVLERTATGDVAEFLVFLGRQADLSAADHLPTKEAKGRFVFEQLRREAELSQRPLLDELRGAGVEHRAYWVANMIWVRADGPLLEKLASRDDVAHVYANPAVELDRPHRDGSAPRKSTPATEPSLDHTLAPDVFWAQGWRGQGVVIGGQDTGYEWNHPALRPHYRGAAGGAVDHNYNWHDSVHSGGGACGPDSKVPCDDDDHGTHTMGTMVGDDGGANRIGMAPGATWIGCRNMDRGVGTPASYSECFEWFLAPTDLESRNPDPDLAPDIINNSWSCPPSEGCQDPNALRTVVENVRAAGILIVVSAGNEGSACETIGNPAGIYDAPLTVGATNLQDQITGFSSRGPVTVDGSDRLKPDVVAPGARIRSSLRGAGYGSLNGTSMSAPHVAGLAALVISSAECLRGNVDAIEKHIIDTAQPVTTDQFCGGPGDQVPNNVYGHGAIRAALPVCGLVAAGQMDGLEGKKLTCRNRSSKPKQKVTTQLGGAANWDCGAAGLSADNGDRLKIQLTATTAGDDAVGGVLQGIPTAKVICKNQTAGGRKTIRPADGEAFDCREAGLQLEAGDTLKLTISGRSG